MQLYTYLTCLSTIVLICHKHVVGAVYLPTTSAATAAAVATASAVATSAAISASTATATAATAAAAIPTAIGLGPRLVDLDGPTVDLAAVHAQSLLGIGGRHRDEGEAADLAGLAVGGEEAVGDRPVLLEGGADGLLGALVGQVADVELDVGEAAGVEAAAAGAGVEVGLGLGLVHLDLAAVEVLAVHGADGLLGGAAVAEGDEGEAAGLAGIAVEGEEDVGDGPVLPERLAEGILRGVEGKVADVQLDVVALCFVRHFSVMFIG
eukprot:CAMPEP_0185805818 /NCGR_PEP_ID=MMETSP1322-20130828/4083_1 /TAXON_ID=265543 /ORGANISM="Minutocellus polymorphus, Strain RCC2270" /LENGTH=264 /DNA_ID=CAMNT_0028501875 /DNA_START=28 /DNA_END=823 /DNA_ORIENTATION=+